MANVQHNAKLNQLFIELNRSLLQYVGQCSSWTNRNETELAIEFQSIVAAQQEHGAELAQLLTDRRWTVDFGGFPADYTDLHFLSLKYLLKLIVDDQRLTISEFDEASHTCIDDPEGLALIIKLLESEKLLTERLCSLLQSAKPAMSTSKA